MTQFGGSTSAQGVRLPLAVGKEWRHDYDAKNMQTGAILRSTDMCKVEAQETVTAPAGTFDTFKIVRQVLQQHSRPDQGFGD
jgi:hypothetical protein